MTSRPAAGPLLTRLLRTPRRVHTVRDLSVWSEMDGSIYVVACDANAGVGLREGDHLRRPPEEAGYNAAKVPLMEVLAAGASPLLVVNTLGSPLDDYGRRVVDGIRRAMADAGTLVPITGSDETNMTTMQTSVGVTVIAVAAPGALLLGGTRNGDVVLCAGVPADGLRRPYREGEPGVASPADVLALRRTGLAHELLPVGSKGVSSELGQLVRYAGMEPTLTVTQTAEREALDLTMSAGASTCFLVSCAPDSITALRAATDLPLTVVAAVTDAGDGFV